ncbi:MAG: oxidoreductase [Actinomycetota bacterium]|nr:MAG: oxidoreductase [Actinomycetota bacterium]
MTRRPRVAVFKMASCDGCQLQILDAEDALLELAGAIEIVNFAEASSDLRPGPYDIALVEGSVSTPEQEAQIREIREASEILITIGACATAGGIQALRNATGRLEEFVRTVYPTPEYVRTLEDSHPVADHVPVDLELTGCPIDRNELLRAIASLLAGARPRIPTSPVCLECKRRGTVCVVVAKGEPCLGPVTRTGCGAICPRFGRGCYGCFGPAQAPGNAEALGRRFVELGLRPKEAADRFRFITGWAPAFREAAARLEEAER